MRDENEKKKYMNHTIVIILGQGWINLPFKKIIDD